MLTCIPTKGPDGLDDTISDHFGSAPFFTIYDTDSDQITIVENRNAHHDHGTCHPMNQLAKHDIDCVACVGMGRRAIEALNSEGIKELFERGVIEEYRER
jgi:predicted Fe-Mo cluster-binding NifX family protein